MAKIGELISKGKSVSEIADEIDDRFFLLNDDEDDEEIEWFFYSYNRYSYQILVTYNQPQYLKTPPFLIKLWL